jgi:hypothetical protein
MLVAVAFVPSAPLLLPALGGGPSDLRSACAQALSALDGADEVVVVGHAEPTGWRSGTVDATPWGAPGPPSTDPLPLPLAVGSSLLGARPHRLLAVDGGAVATTGSTGLLVVGDGSARRTEKAPGHLDLRAEPFDEAVVAAVRDADPDGLDALDPDLAQQLLVGGLPAWRTAAATARLQGPGAWAGELLYAGAPFGVGYLVATWLPRPGMLSP